MTKSMALDLAERETGIRVNSIHPGFADTPLVENAIAELEPEEGEQFSAAIAERAKLGLADPDQIAAAPALWRFRIGRPQAGGRFDV